MFDKSELAKCKEIDISTCDVDSLVDLRQINIDTTRPITERIESFLKQVRNPYLFKVGDIAMKVDYGSGKEFGEAFTDILCKR